MAVQTRLREPDVAFIAAQRLFFVGTAAPDGRVNISPKGMDTLRVLDPGRIVWLGLTGSGNETAGHLAEHDRMTLMFCAFEGDARITRVYGSAKVYHPRDAEWADLVGLFPSLAGSRQIFDLAVDLVQHSCGTGIPVYEYRHDRGPTELLPFYDDMGADGVRAYWERKNSVTIDGKPTHIFDD